jgi:eukaryotic-like serine/threonine-protein kinase
MSEESIFLGALEKETPEQRAAFLAAACGGDEALRHSVELLLWAHEKAGDFLQRTPTCSGRITDRSPAEGPGSRIGPYQLVQKIGEGGMGAVWMAEQTEPVCRRVALKVIKPGMDSKQVIARFEAERQALALMDHPHIAKVLDAGATSSGRPYFVMELVQGAPITTFCDDHRLTPRERLGLFVHVCQAVQHAHQKGIIHRDLKPGNVLVMSPEGTPSPYPLPHDGGEGRVRGMVKVIDFGVAKAVGRQLTDKTVNTRFTQMVGTPLYMSPEQAGQGGLDIDTRTDIYALGVLLYELLTGTTPFDRERLRQAGYDEIRRIIREEEPARPSTRISMLGGTLPAMSAQRQTDPKLLIQLVRGELDWIVMKALEKDRNQRYESASGFAADVQRYLHDEPVQACPPSLGYRLRKFVKRHRGPVLAAAVVLLALVAGVVGTTLGLVEAWHQRDLAEQARKNEAEQRNAAVANAEKAKDEEGKAKTALDEARRLATEEKAARNRAEWLLYGSQISLAQQAWESEDGFLAYHYLESCCRDFRGWEHDYLFTLFNRNQQELRGHTGPVNGVAVSPDGKRIVSGSYDQTVKVWDAATGQLTRTLKGHTSGVVCVAFDGRRVVSGSEDGMIKVWDAATGQETLTLRGQTGQVNPAALSPDGKRIASASADATVRVWDATTGEETLTLKGHTGQVRCVAFSSDGKHIVSGSDDTTVKVWDAATGQENRTFRGQTGVVSSVAFSPDGRRVVSGSWDATVKVWDAATGQETLTLKGHTSTVTSVAFSPDGRRLVSGSGDKTVKVWNAATGQETLTLKGHNSGRGSTGFAVSSVAFSPDGRRLVSGSWDTTVKVWDIATGQRTLTFNAYQRQVSSVAFSPDGQQVVSGGLNTTVKVWDAASGKETLTLKGHLGEVSSVAFSPDGRRIVSGSWDKTVKVWDVVTGHETLTLRGHTDLVRGVAVSPDGMRIASASIDGTVKVWDAGTGQETLTLNGHTGGVLCVTFSPDGKHLVSAEKDNTARVWDTATGQETLTLRGHTKWVVCVAFCPDGRRLVTGSLDNSVKVWDAATGREALTLRGHTHLVNGVAVSPDGRRIVSGSYDDTVKVWEAVSGYETLTLRGHTALVSSVAFSPDGKRIASGSTDGTVKVWDASMSQQKP